MSTLVSKTEFARLAGVSAAAVTKACRTAFPAALIGTRIDLDHADTRRYLARRAFASTSTPPAPASSPFTPTTLRPLQAVPSPSTAAQTAAESPPLASAPHRDTTPNDVARYAHMSLDELTNLFGTATAFVDWLDARKRISDLRARDTQYAERTGKLIQREFVRVHVFGALDGLFKRLLQDAAVTLAQRVMAAGRSGKSDEEAVELVRDIIGSELRETKERVVQALRHPQVNEAAKAS